MRLDKFLLKCADKGYKPELVAGLGSEAYSSCHTILYKINECGIKFHKRLDGTDEWYAPLTHPDIERVLGELGI